MQAAKMRDARALWPVCGPNWVSALRLGPGCGQSMRVDLGFRVGAGEGNRTLMTSLEGCGPQPSELLWPRSGHVCQLPRVPLKHRR
jgi:hypothetical protein